MSEKTLSERYDELSDQALALSRKSFVGAVVIAAIGAYAGDSGHYWFAVLLLALAAIASALGVVTYREGIHCAGKALELELESDDRDD